MQAAPIAELFMIKFGVNLNQNGRPLVLALSTSFDLELEQIGGFGARS